MKSTTAPLSIGHSTLHPQKIDDPKLSYTAPIRPDFGAGLKSFFRNLTTKVIQSVVAFLENDQELKIWQSTDRDGTLYWQAYDPVSGHSTIAYSEDDLRAWIENHYMTNH